MINITEIRIGNYVNHHGEIITVDCINDIDVFNKKCGDIPLHSIQPIRLSQDILLKCGFETRETMYTKNADYFLGNILICFYNTGIEVYFGVNKIPNIEYLHQLQNLYYITTTKELKIEP